MQKQRKQSQYRSNREELDIIKMAKWLKKSFINV